MLTRLARPLVAFLALLLAAPAFAADAIPATVDDGAVIWTPATTYAQALLTLSAPDGLEYRRAFTAGQAIRLHPSETGDVPMADGFYGYRLMVVSEGEGERPAVVQSGTVEVRSSRVVASPLLDQVIADDLIVQGSICAGFDCVDGESFGFDTMRLKENNLRMHFDDTSTTGGFPANDWRITINDQASGGSNYFAVDDATAGRTIFRLAAGAPSNALTVDSNGDLGVGVADAVVELHVADGDSPTLRLEQDGASGFTPQTWDVAGNETNFFVRDATNGSKLPFKIRPNSPTDLLVLSTQGVSIAKPNAGSGAVLDVNGVTRVGFPSSPAVTPSTNAIFEVNGDTDNDGVQDRNARFRSVVRFDLGIAVVGNLSGQASAISVINQAGGNTPIFNLTPAGNLTIAGTLSQGSDVTRKHDIVAVDPAAVLDGVVGLPISTWEYVTSDGVTHMGPMAQDFYATFGLGQGETTISVVDADGVALAAIQALHARSQADRARIAELEAVNADLEARLARIEALVSASQN